MQYNKSINKFMGKSPATMLFGIHAGVDMSVGWDWDYSDEVCAQGSVVSSKPQFVCLVADLHCIMQMHEESGLCFFH